MANETETRPGAHVIHGRVVLLAIIGVAGIAVYFGYKDWDRISHSEFAEMWDNFAKGVMFNPDPACVPCADTLPTPDTLPMPDMQVQGPTFAAPVEPSVPVEVPQPPVVAKVVPPVEIAPEPPAPEPVPQPEPEVVPPPIEAVPDAPAETCGDVTIENVEARDVGYEPGILDRSRFNDAIQVNITADTDEAKAAGIRALEKAYAADPERFNGKNIYFAWDSDCDGVPEKIYCYDPKTGEFKPMPVLSSSGDTDYNDIRSDEKRERVFRKNFREDLPGRG